MENRKKLLLCDNGQIVRISELLDDLDNKQTCNNNLKAIKGVVEASKATKIVLVKRIRSLLFFPLLILLVLL